MEESLRGLTMKSIILCADDYGQNTAISQAIIELLKKKHLSATSCMTNSYYWDSQAKWLQPVKDEVDIGLHFNLTEGKPLSREGRSLTKGLGLDLMPISDLIVRAYLGRLKQADIETELYAQIERFIAYLGREPDFIDGHQHIQQLPIIRDAFLRVYEKRLKKTGCYIRSVYTPAAFMRFKDSGYIKMLIIQLCGARTFKKQLTQLGIPHNSSFSGFYDFSHAKKYSTLFPGFLECSKDNGIIMCHPGLPASSEGDSNAEARYWEYQYLNSDQFSIDCEKYGVTIGRFRHEK